MGRCTTAAAHPSHDTRRRSIAGADRRATALLRRGARRRYARIRLGSAARRRYKDIALAPVGLKCEADKVDADPHVSARRTAPSCWTDAAASVQVNETASGGFILRPVVTPV
jgi:hypothetical protein